MGQVGAFGIVIQSIELNRWYIFSLSVEQQNTELRVAIRCKFVQDVAKQSTMLLDLPSDSEISTRSALACNLTCQTFVNWWTNYYKMGITPVRSRFLVQESLASLKNPEVVAAYVTQSRISESEAKDLAVWAAASLALLPASMPVVMVDNPIQGTTSTSTSDTPPAAASSKRASSKQTDRKNMTTKSYADLPAEPLPEELNTAAFRRFRSWYQGGLVMMNHFTSIACDEKSRDRGSRPVTPSMLSEGDKRVVKKKQYEFTLNRLLDRHRTFETKINLYEECLKAVENLVNGYKHALQNQLKDTDLTVKRSKLSDEDILAIMASTKLKEVFHARGFSTAVGRMPDVSLIGGAAGYYSASKIVGFDILDDPNPAFFKPADAPIFVRATIPGTERRPIKPWQACSENEKLLEVALACQLDAIIMAALGEGIAIPDPEDIYLNPKAMFSLRTNRLKLFIAWYAGAEATDHMAGRGIPTEMRTVVSENWERKVLECDPGIFSRMIQLGFHRSENESQPQSQQVSPGRARSPTGGDNDSKDLESDVYEPFPLRPMPSTADVLAKLAALKNPREAQHASELNELRGDSRIVLEGFSPLVELYDDCLTLPKGVTLRLDMLRRYVDALMYCRRLLVSRLLYPPGPVKMGQQYMYPQAGMILPKLEFPMKRYRLFPSRNIESYTIPEIMKWFPEDEELDEDDKEMMAAELVGQKRRKYLEWLAQESVRQAETRRQMLEEDKSSRIFRKYWKDLDKRIAKDSDKRNRSLSVSFIRMEAVSTSTPAGRKLSARKKRETMMMTYRQGPDVARVDEDEICSDDDTDVGSGVDDLSAAEPAESEEASAYAISGLVPKDLSFLRPTEDDPFMFGSGIENDDELEDFKEASRLAALRRIEEEKLMKQRMQDERLRKERDEANRIKREEQDRRLEEGMERRRHARERFDELKAKRQQEIEEAKRIENEKLAVAAAIKAEAERQATIQAGIQAELNCQAVERQNMYQEEMYLREVIIRHREERLMQEEDILSSIREMKDIEEDKQKAERRAYLTKLYEPFVPFEFKKIRLPVLHSLLDRGTETTGNPADNTGNDSFDYLFPPGELIKKAQLETVSSIKNLIHEPSGYGVLDAHNAEHLYFEHPEHRFVQSLNLLDSREAIRGPTTLKAPKKPCRLIPISTLTAQEKLLVLSSSSRYPNYVDTFLGKPASTDTHPHIKFVRPRSANMHLRQLAKEKRDRKAAAKLAQSQSLPKLDSNAAAGIDVDNASVGSLGSQGSSKFLSESSDDDHGFTQNKAKAHILAHLSNVDRHTLKEKQKELAMASLSSLGEGGGTLLPFGKDEHFVIPGLSGVRATNTKPGPKKKTAAFYNKAFVELDSKEKLIAAGLDAPVMASPFASSPSRTPSVSNFNLGLDPITEGEAAAANLAGASAGAGNGAEERVSSPGPLLRRASGVTSPPMPGFSRSNTTKLERGPSSSNMVLQRDNSWINREESRANTGVSTAPSSSSAPSSAAAVAGTSSRDRSKAVVIPMENGVPRSDLLPLTRAADETVRTMKSERQAIRDYITSKAFMKDKYYLAAALPNIRDVSFLDATFADTREHFAQPRYTSPVQDDDNAAAARTNAETATKEDSAEQDLVRRPSIRFASDIAADDVIRQESTNDAIRQESTGELNVSTATSDKLLKTLISPELTSGLMAEAIVPNASTMSKIAKPGAGAASSKPAKAAATATATAKKAAADRFAPYDTKQVAVEPPFGYHGTFGVKGKVAEIQKVPMNELLTFKLNRQNNKTTGTKAGDTTAGAAASVMDGSADDNIMDIDRSAMLGGLLESTVTNDSLALTERSGADSEAAVKPAYSQSQSQHSSKMVSHLRSSTITSGSSSAKGGGGSSTKQRKATATKNFGSSSAAPSLVKQPSDISMDSANNSQLQLPSIDDASMLIAIPNVEQINDSGRLATSGRDDDGGSIVSQTSHGSSTILTSPPLQPHIPAVSVSRSLVEGSKSVIEG
jgi:hypothetical protein